MPDDKAPRKSTSAPKRRTGSSTRAGATGTRRKAPTARRSSPPREGASPTSRRTSELAQSTPSGQNDVRTNARPEARRATAPSASFGDYLLLDSGNQRKLERVGEYLLVRPSPQALWSPRLSEADWERADGIFHRDSDGDGNWEWRTKVKREFDVLFGELSLQLRLTNFGHMGLFPEQAGNWDWMRDVIRERMIATHQRNLHVLNLFGYTGGSSLACSQAGAHVVHLDAAKGVVDWARINARLSNLDERPIRWLVDDAMKFLKREERRDTRYQAIILDPPSFGRGPQGEVFKIETDIIPLLELCRDRLADDGLFVFYSCHTPGFTPLTMKNQIEEVLGKRGGAIESGEMTVNESNGRPLPSGTWARWYHA